jgi:hypothetical protein
VRDIVLEALAFDKHEETGGQRIGLGDGQGAGGAVELVSFRVELERISHGKRVREEGACV